MYTIFIYILQMEIYELCLFTSIYVCHICVCKYVCAYTALLELIRYIRNDLC